MFRDEGGVGAGVGEMLTLLLESGWIQVPGWGPCWLRPGFLGKWQQLWEAQHAQGHGDQALLGKEGFLGFQGRSTDMKLPEPNF